MDFDTSILESSPQQILRLVKYALYTVRWLILYGDSLKPEQYATILRLYNEQEESGIDNSALKSALNALTSDIINTCT